MEAFGVRFGVNERGRLNALRSVFHEIKRDKDNGRFRDPGEWVLLVLDEVKSRFVWPTPEEREHWLAVRASTLVAISEPAEQLGRSGTSTEYSRRLKRGNTTLSNAR